MTTLAAEIKTSIDSWVEALRRTSTLGTLAREGKLSSRALALYLESLRYLFRNSQLNLQLAALTSRKLGLSELSEYFALKAREEKGHDTWAIDDLARLPNEAATGIEPSPSIVRLVELQKTLIAEHPVCFVAYALWAEYFTVTVGDEWLDALATSGFGRDQVSAFAKHVDADRAHAERGLTEIDRLWLGQPDRGTILGVIDRASRIFEKFCDEISTEAQRAA